MKIQDDRTESEKLTHRFLIVGTDTFLSNWGMCGGSNYGPSYAAWACKEDLVDEMFDRISDRCDMKRVRIVVEDHERNPKQVYRPRGPGHLHIYVAND